jgi:hypothetical protein
MAQVDNNEREEQMEFVVLYVCVVIGVFVAIYIYYIDIWFYTQKAFFTAFAFLPDIVNKVLFFWHQDAAEFIPGMAADLNFHVKDYVEYYKFDEVGQRKLDAINRVGRFMVIPYLSLPIVWFFLKEWRRKESKILGMGKPHAMYAYAFSQKEIWPFIKPVAAIMERISREPDLDSGWYAMSKLPMMWMKERGLFNEMTKKKRRELFTVSQRREFTLNKPKAFLALVENLGPVWKGIENLTFEQKCVLAILIPHIYGKIKVSRLLNRKICCLHEAKTKLSKYERKELLKTITSEVDSILLSHKDCFEIPYFVDTEFDEPYDPILSSFEGIDSEKDMFDKGRDLIKGALLRHSYVKTMFFSLIERCWTYGVLSSSELLWVKSVDRDLFYVLSQQGRTSAFVEVCGAWSHYLAESTYGFKILAPQVSEGLRGLDFDLFKTHSNYIAHERWIDNSKWDKLVPDVNNKGGLPKPQSSSNTSAVV